MNGYDLCKILKAKVDTKNIPIIFLTAKIDEDSIEKAYDVGGSDYITKPFKPKELLARIKTQLQIRDLISTLEFLASRDSMTGAYNRRKFFELSEEILINNFESNIYGVMIDIDKFKAINDNFGHPIGDEVIELVANKIDEYLSKDDIFGRIGGEEFAIISIESSFETIKEKLERIRIEVSNLELKVKDEVIKFTISLGVAKYSEELNDIDKLLKEADRLLYKAKNNGRNRIICVGDVLDINL
jgi:diguanylate cyclase (GGDEF)-like protein